MELVPVLKDVQDLNVLFNQNPTEELDLKPLQIRGYLNLNLDHQQDRTRNRVGEHDHKHWLIHTPDLVPVHLEKIQRKQLFYPEPTHLTSKTPRTKNWNFVLIPRKKPSVHYYFNMNLFPQFHHFFQCQRFIRSELIQFFV